MLFCSQDFVVFFCLVFALYWAIPNPRARTWLLLAASFYFYARWNQWLALLIIATSTMDFAVGLGLDRLRSERNRRLLLVLALAVNLGMLAAFKYANFFLDSFEAMANSCGFGVSIPTLTLILPVGISFYTFESINYTVDVYRKRIPAERNLSHFLLFITFFPHLVAGPIVRAKDFLPQIGRLKRWDWARIELGVSLFLLGLFKKMAIADRMALYVDPVFAHPESYGSAATWVATIAYAIQIYCDFSGYTDMALGCAHVLGFKLAKNFQMPYLAVNPSEFWRRWHISLSGWLRDYVFIPLGGSRGTNRRTARNLLITMTLGGLWHGASWTFIVWGFYHGIVLILHRGFQAIVRKRPAWNRILTTRGGMILRTASTFVIVCVGWVFFRAESFRSAGILLRRLFVPMEGASPPLPLGAFWTLLGVVIVAHAVGMHPPRKPLPAPVVGLGYAAALTLALLLAPNSGNAFIYFQF